MGKGGGKGGGGGGQAATVPIPSGLYQTIASTSGLGGYASSLLNPLASMTNWAANLASGGHAGQIPAFGTVAQQAGPPVIFGGRGKAWQSSFDPTSGLITFTNPSNPAQTFVQSIEGGATGGNMGSLPQETLDQWKAEFAQNKGGSGAGSTAVAGLPATASQIPSTVSIPQWQDWYAQNVGKTIYINGQLQTLGSSIGPDAVLSAFRSNQVSWGSPDMNTALGPFLGSAWNAIQAQQGLPAQMKPVEQQTTDLTNQAQAQATQLYNQAQPMYDQANQMISKGQQMLDQAQASGDEGLIAQGQQMIQQGNTMLSNAQDMFARANDMFAGGNEIIQAGSNMFTGANEIIATGGDIFSKGTAMVDEATSGTGLFPSQAAYIEQIRQQGETQSAAQLARLGLSESTMAPALREQADLAAAGTAGQLIQGNIAAAEAEQAQGIAEQQTGLSARQQAIAEQQTGLTARSQAIAEQQTGISAQGQAIAEQQAGVSTVTSGIQARQEAEKVALAETGLGQAQTATAQQQVQLSQGAQKIALGGQALEVGEQQAVFDMYSNIFSNSTQFQSTLWQEALSGYGMLGNIISTAGQQYGYSLGGYKTVVDALAATAQNQTAAQQAQQQADSASTSSLFGALGKILGGAGGAGAGSGLLGGSLGAAEGAAAGGAGGGGSIIGSIVGLIGSLFSWI